MPFSSALHRELFKDYCLALPSASWHRCTCLESCLLDRKDIAQKWDVGFSVPERPSQPKNRCIALFMEQESLVSIKRERSEDGGSPGSKRSRADHDASAGEARRAEGAAAGPEVRLGRPDAPGAAGTVDLIDLCESPSPETHMAEPPRE